MCFCVLVGPFSLVSCTCSVMCVQDGPRGGQRKAASLHLLTVELVRLNMLHSYMHSYIKNPCMQALHYTFHCITWHHITSRTYIHWCCWYYIVFKCESIVSQGRLLLHFCCEAAFFAPCLVLATTLQMKSEATGWLPDTKSWAVMTLGVWWVLAAKLTSFPGRPAVVSPECLT